MAVFLGPSDPKAAAQQQLAAASHGRTAGTEARPMAQQHGKRTMATNRVWPCHHCGTEHPLGENPCHKKPLLIGEAIDVMRQGGFQVCDSAIEKWHSGKYGPVDIRAHVFRWKCIRDLVREMCADLKQSCKETCVKQPKGDEL